MSDDELSDDMQELNELIAEYREKEEAENGDKANEQNEESEQNNANEAVKKQKNVDTSGPIEVPMDKVLFGDKDKLLKNLKRAVGQKAKTGDDEEEKEGSKKKRKPVWVDEDDEVIQLGDVKKENKRTGPLDHLKLDKSYKEHLTARFTRIVNQPKWANLDEKDKAKRSDDEGDDGDLLRTVGFLSKPAEGILLEKHISAKRMKDVNRATYAEGNINSIQFHPSSTAALVAGDKGIASIYAIDGTQNDKLHNIHIPNFPIKCARLLPCGTKAVFGSNAKYAYLYDLMTAKETRYNLRKDSGNLSNFTISPCGRYMVSAGLCGEIHIQEAKTFEIIASLKQNDKVATICFTNDSLRLVVSGNSANVCVFSMRQQRLEHRFIDDGCIAGKAMDLSPNQRLLATGSMEGVVNVYDFENIMQTQTPLPIKSFLNLRTAISSVRFNHSSEILAFASSRCPNALKLAHFPSGTVYANFPGFMPNLGNVNCMEFSPHSAYLALGNNKECPLFRLKHFKNY
ncbi:U3 small nucleolar RNA-associated protein 18 homolog [Musca domestica]|uniref:U3 small nucleolar RNA-associated protein 18 homolog n=1 Tax=Musca domestica TaxID=7370 RepID=A0A1I8N868_MUSDO|nr:U3 small nucleolar RNA-associated protein 18 homolog [Musca domestica]